MANVKREVMRAGIKAWFLSKSGLKDTDVSWGTQPTGWQGPCRAHLKLIRGGAIGRDETRTTVRADGNLDVETVGNRSLTLRITVTSRNGNPDVGETAGDILERVRDHLDTPSTYEALSAVGLGRVGSASLVEMPRVFDGREESKAQLDIRLNATSRVTDAQSGVIETVKHQGKDLQADGETFTLPEQTTTKP